MEIIEKNKTLVLHDSLGEFVEYTERKNVGGGISSKRTKDNWTGNFNLEDSRKAATYGWDERPAEVGKLAEELNAAKSGEIQQQVMVPSTDGAFVNMQAFLDGEPECMMQFTTEPVKQAIKIGFNVSTSAVCETATFHLRGAIVLAITEALSSAGFPVEVTVYRACKNDSHSCLEGFKLKASESYLDLDALAFFCAHPAALRCLWFAHSERLPTSNHSAGRFGRSGYGHPAKLGHLDKELTEALPLDVNIDCAPSSFPQAKRYYDTMLNKLQDEGLIELS